MSDECVGSTNAVLVHVFFDKLKQIEDIKEFQSLVKSFGFDIFHVFTCSRKSPHPKYFVGEGKAFEIANMVRVDSIFTVFFNHSLSPIQERNLQKIFECRVIDRINLILNIFARRAYSYEGKLQVELAKLRYLSTRLVHGWSHLSRQKGGFFYLKGPGETQLEIDRRCLRDQTRKVVSRLRKVEKHREQNRNSRTNKNILTVSLVGYTNAGKSTLFNIMTQAAVKVSKSYFSTLDPICRRICLVNIGNIVLVDTVGFIKEIPYYVIAAFRATLKEAMYSELLLHIVDVSDSCFDQNIIIVNNILKDIHLDKFPVLLVMNKIDKLVNLIPRIDRDQYGSPVRVWISAQTGVGISLLIQAISEKLNRCIVQYNLLIPPNNSGKLCNSFYKLHAIEYKKIEEDGSINVMVKLPFLDWCYLCKKNKLLTSYII